MPVMETLASAITIAAAAYQVSVTVTTLVRGIKSQGDDIRQLEERARSLSNVLKVVENAYKAREETISLVPEGPSEANLRRLITDAATRCKEELESFVDLLKDVSRRKPRLVPGLETALTRWRMDTAKPAFLKIQKAMEEHRSSLNMLLQLDHKHSIQEARRDIQTMRVEMAHGVAALYAQNRQLSAQMTANSQEFMEPAGIPLARQDTQTTLVPTSENEDQTTSMIGNNPILRQLFEGILAVCVKNMSADGRLGPPSTSPSQVDAASDFPSEPSEFNPSAAQSLFDKSYTLSNGHPLRQTSPGIGSEESEPSGALRPISSHLSRASSSSYGSVITTDTGSSRSGKSQQSEQDRVKLRKERASVSWARASGTTRAAKPLKRSESTDKQRGIQLLNYVKSAEIEHIGQLIEEGASLEETDEYEKTPFLVATELGNKDAAQLLMANGALLTATDQKQCTALHFAIRRPSAHDIVPYIIEALSSTPSDPITSCHPLINAGDSTGRTPLHECALHGNIPLAKTFLAHGADINAQDNQKRPPAHYAMEEQKVMFTEFLILEGADFSSFDWPPPHKYGGNIKTLLQKHGLLSTKRRSSWRS